MHCNGTVRFQIPNLGKLGVSFKKVKRVVQIRSLIRTCKEKCLHEAENQLLSIRNVFSTRLFSGASVSDSVPRGEGSRVRYPLRISYPPLGPDPLPGPNRTKEPGTRQEVTSYTRTTKAGGAHPSRMLSC